jgi:hypothetical protein
MTTTPSKNPGDILDASDWNTHTITADQVVGGVTDEKVKVDGSDTTTDYLNNKIVVTSAFTKTILNSSGNEQIQIGLYTALTGSITNDTPTHEKGETVNDINLSWSYNNALSVTSQSINQGIGSIPLGTYTHALTAQGLTTNKTWTLTATDGTTTINPTTTVAFYDKRYWEPNTITGPPTDGEIIAMTSEFASSRGTTKSFDCSGGKYIWICYPASWGAGTFWVGGLQVTFTLFSKTFVNASGYSTSYYCYRSNNILNGSITVTVQ